jgi:hypothetical protein
MTDLGPGFRRNLICFLGWSGLRRFRRQRARNDEKDVEIRVLDKKKENAYYLKLLGIVGGAKQECAEKESLRPR